MTTKTAATPGADTKTAATPKAATVKMIRDEEQFPEGPYTADVHPDEVENYRVGGWIEA